MHTVGPNARADLAATRETASTPNAIAIVDRRIFLPCVVVDLDPDDELPLGYLTPCVSQDPLHKRCGSCARFVRVVEEIDDTGEVKRSGECLLGVWPAPLYATSTCGQWVQRGAFTSRPQPKQRMRVHRGSSARSSSDDSPARATGDDSPIQIPEELLDMDADEFRSVLRQVIREELAVKPVELGGRWVGGEVVLKPGKEGTAEKRVPLETFFHKIVMVRDRLRVLEQRINGSAKLDPEEKVQLQQYITQCYGSLTTFNVLFAEKGDQFVGQRSDD